MTSSYLEGDDNALGAYGYNRDGKKGKKQIVIGLLCDQQGEPVSTEVFRGNTQDTATFASQVKKASQRFACERVTFVGDRGMIKSGQIEDLSKAGFHYITAITKPQIETLLKTGLLQMALFDDTLCEVEQVGVQAVLLQRLEALAEDLLGGSLQGGVEDAGGKLDAGKQLTHRSSTGQAQWLHVINGDLATLGERLETGDGAAIENAETLALESREGAEFLLFDLK